MELVNAVKLDEEFIEHLYDVIVSVIPSVSQKADRVENIRKVENIVKWMLTNNKWQLDRADPDWLTIIMLTVKYFPEEASIKK